MEAVVRFLRTHLDVGVVGPMILSPDDVDMPNGSMFPSVWRELYRSVGFHRLINKRFERDEFGRIDLKVEAEVAGACLSVRRASARPQEHVVRRPHRDGSLNWLEEPGMESSVHSIISKQQLGKALY